MRRTLIQLLLVVLFSSFATASTNTVQVCVGAASGSSCDPDVSEVGTRVSDGPPNAHNVGYVYCGRYTAECSGDLATGYAEKTSGDSGTVKICVYKDTTSDSGAPDSSDTLVGCSGELTSVAAGLISATVSSGSVVADDDYYVCLAVDNDSANPWDNDRAAATATLYYGNFPTFFDSPPSDLDLALSSASSNQRTVYVTID